MRTHSNKGYDMAPISDTEILDYVASLQGKPGFGPKLSVLFNVQYLEPPYYEYDYENNCRSSLQLYPSFYMVMVDIFDHENNIIMDFDIWRELDGSLIGEW